MHEKQKSGKLISDKDNLKIIGCRAHRELARNAADKSITLVKNTQNILPISAKTHKNVCVFVISSPPISRGNQPDPVKEIIRKEMEHAGYDVHMHDSYYDLILREGIGLESELKSVVIGKVEEFKKKYDTVFVFINMKGYAQENNVRLAWSIGHSIEIPWYMQEVPTVFISLNYTNHLHDIPMAKTYINSYAPTREVIRQTIRKIAGQSAFKGEADDNVFCGRWDTRL